MRKLLLATAVLAALATPAFARGTTCVRHNDIYNWTSLSDKLLVVENYRHQKVLLKLIGTCYGFKFREAIANHKHNNTDHDSIGPGDDVFVRDMGIGGRCAVVSVSPYYGSAGSKPRDDGHDDHGGDHHDHSSN